VFEEIGFIQDLMLNYKSRFDNRAFVVEILKLFQSKRILIGDDSIEFDLIMNEIEKNVKKLENTKFRSFNVPVRDGLSEANVDYI
jgi:hypothetical protein